MSWPREAAARAVAATAVVLVGLTVVAVRAWVSSTGERVEADALRSSTELEDLRDAVLHYRRAASWYVPGTPHATRALDALERIATAAERAGQRELALAAWRGIRAAVVSARAPLPPYPERLARADAGIARTGGVPPGPAVGPRPWAGLLAPLGLVLFVGGSMALFALGFDAGGRLRRAPAARAALCAGVGALVAVLGLWLA